MGDRGDIASLRTALSLSIIVSILIIIGESSQGHASSGTHVPSRTSASCLLLLGPPAACRVLCARAAGASSRQPSGSVSVVVCGPSRLQRGSSQLTLAPGSESREARRLRAGFPSGQGWGGGVRAGGPAAGGGGVAEGRPRIVIQ